MNCKKIPTNILEWLENKLSEIVKDDICETVSDFTTIECLHMVCKTTEEYYEVIDFLKKNPNTTRNDVYGVLAEIDNRHIT